MDGRDRKSTRLNSSHTKIYTLSLPAALPFWADHAPPVRPVAADRKLLGPQPLHLAQERRVPRDVGEARRRRRAVAGRAGEAVQEGRHLAALDARRWTE